MKKCKRSGGVKKIGTIKGKGPGYGKPLTVTLIALSCILMLASCAGMPKLFNPPKPYCTIEEQKTSLIYKYLNPSDARFVLVGSLGYVLERDKTKAEPVKRHLLTLKDSVNEGITYAALEKYVMANFKSFTGIIISEALINFQGVDLALSECDQRLVLGAINRLLEIVALFTEG